MTVFLRWGIFGILGGAALIYAYNASKRLAEAHSTHDKPAPVAAANQPETATAPATGRELNPRCEAELVVAQRAVDARRQGEPIDRLLRMQEIAFEEQPRRARLESVATRWYGFTGTEPTPQALSDAVIKDCESFSPAP